MCARNRGDLVLEVEIARWTRRGMGAEVERHIYRGTGKETEAEILICIWALIEQAVGWPKN